MRDRQMPVLADIIVWQAFQLFHYKETGVGRVVSVLLRALLPVVVVMPFLALTGCARTAPSSEEEAAIPGDPMEVVNRTIFDGNQYVGDALAPLARGYTEGVSEGIRRGVLNFAANIAEPAAAINNALQGNMEFAGDSTGRFLVNTTAGGIGIFDIASDWGLSSHPADLGQTLGVWGVGTGPSVQLPLLGPSNMRDTAGLLFGSVTNPGISVDSGTAVALTMVGYAEQRAEEPARTDGPENGSEDPYLSQRAAYAKQRAAFIEAGRTGPGEK